MKESKQTHSLICSLDNREQTYRLDTTWNTIGRNGDKCNIIIPSASISKVHCKVLVNGNRGFIRDLGSKNGVYINEERIESDTIREFDIKNVKLEIADVSCRIGIEKLLADSKTPPMQSKVQSPRLISNKRFREESEEEQVEAPKKSIKTKQNVPKYLDEEPTSIQEIPVTKQRPEKKNKRIKEVTTEREISEEQPIKESQKRERTKKQKNSEGANKIEKRNTIVRIARHEPRDQQQRIPQPRISHISIILSGVKEEYGRKPIPQITIVNKLTQDYSVCVMAKYHRTIKLLYSICKGCYIVDIKWLNNCIKAQQLLPYESALIAIPSERKVIRRSIQKVKEGYRVFKDLQFCLYGSNFHCDKTNLEELIVVGGGTITTIRQLEYPKASTYIIVPEQTSEIDKKILAQLKNYSKEGYQIHRVEMILDSCLRQDLQLDNTRFDP